MWWLKALSDEEIARPSLGDRYRTHVEVPTFDAASLPVIAPPERRVPSAVGSGVTGLEQTASMRSYTTQDGRIA